MLKIQGTRNYLYQWDLNQKVIVVDNDSVNEVHFVNEGQNDNALIVEVKEDSKARYAEIPNILLQSGDNIIAYEHCEDNGEYTFRKYLLEVIRRPKPADYVYTETEIKSYEALQADLDKKIDAPQVAQVGEVLTVEEVDAEGKPKKWKTQTVETEPPDWNENDPTKPGYVKNRTHYDSRHAVELFNTTVENTSLPLIKVADVDIDVAKIDRVKMNIQIPASDGSVRTIEFDSDGGKITQNDVDGDGSQIVTTIKKAAGSEVQTIILPYFKTNEVADEFTKTTGVYTAGLYVLVEAEIIKGTFVGFGGNAGELKTIDPKYIGNIADGVLTIPLMQEFAADAWANDFSYFTDSWLTMNVSAYPISIEINGKMFQSLPYSAGSYGAFTLGDVNTIGVEITNSGRGTSTQNVRVSSEMFPDGITSAKVYKTVPVRIPKEALPENVEWIADHEEKDFVKSQDARFVGEYETVYVEHTNSFEYFTFHMNNHAVLMLFNSVGSNLLRHDKEKYYQM